MHYRNGRPAKCGDVIVSIGGVFGGQPTLRTGILFNAVLEMIGGVARPAGK